MPFFRQLAPCCAHALDRLCSFIVRENRLPIYLPCDIVLHQPLLPGAGTAWLVGSAGLGVAAAHAARSSGPK